MKVLMFGWEFPPMITGGLGTACQGLSEELSHLIEKVTFVLPRRERSHEETTKGSHFQLLDSEELVQDLKVEDLNREFTHLESSVEHYSVFSGLSPYLSEAEYKSQIQKLQTESKTSVHEGGELALTQRMSLKGGYGADLFAEVFRFARIASRSVFLDQYDIIHAHDWMTFPAGVAAKQRLGCPLVVHVHSLEFDRSGDQINQQVYDLERYGMENADYIIAVSHRTKEMITTHYGIEPRKVRVIHNAISSIGECPPHRKWFNGPLVVFMGRITMQKGPEYFLNAAYLVSQKIPNAQFVMAGHGDMRDRMILKMAELKLIEHFHFPGFVDHKHRADLLSMADVFVLSSVSEPFGLTPMEALQFGVPVIVSKQSGVSEILHHPIKVDFWDARKMADAILKILKEPNLALELGQGGRSELSGLTWQRPAREVKKLYEEILS